MLGKGNRKGNDGIQGYREAKERSERRRNTEVAKKRRSCCFKERGKGLLVKQTKREKEMGASQKGDNKQTNVFRGFVR